MHYKSKKFPLLIAGMTSIVYSRTLFFTIDDPEGPNLLIVIVMATIIYCVSFFIYKYLPLSKHVSLQQSLSSLKETKNLLIIIVIQMIIATVFYFLLQIF